MIELLLGASRQHQGPAGISDIGLDKGPLPDAWMQVPTKVAAAIKQVLANLAYGIKVLADADDNKDLLDGGALPKALL